jgi:PEP-CTERM motif
MSRLVPVSLIALFATFAATTAAFAGATRVSVPEPSSLALLASGVGIVYAVRKLRRRKS